MQKWLMTVTLISLILGCSSTNGSPKDALSKFLTAMEKNNFQEAKKYATADSQGFLDMIDKNGSSSSNVYSGKSFTIGNIETNGNEAKVETRFSSSGHVYFYLKNENGWKVKFNMGALMNMVKDLIKTEGVDIDDEINKAVDSLKINEDSLP